MQTLHFESLDYIVTGTGRCGTVYLAKLLSSIGIPCGHETIFKADGLINALKRMNNEESLELSKLSQLASIVDEKNRIYWFKDKDVKLRADSSYLAAPFLDQFEKTKIIHVIRKPLEVINSFVHGLGYFKDSSLKDEELKDYHEFIYSFFPEMKKMDTITKAAYYYLKWNELIEKKAKNYFLFRIESDPSKLLNWLGIKTKRFYNNKESNHKIGLQLVCNSFDYIKDIKVRNDLIKLYRKYYEVKIC